MGLGKATEDTIVLGAATCADLNRQSCGLQTLIECPADRVDCRSVLEWLLRPRLNLWMPKLGGSLGVLPAIAWFAGKREVAGSVCPSARFRYDVLDLQRNARDPAICATSFPLFYMLPR